MTTGGGITNAYNLDITTSGTSSAAIRSDRGGGTVYVDKGTYKTTGKGLPTIYSTADIIVNNDKSGNFLRAKSDSWGNSNSNGGNVTVNLTSQKITGNIVIDKISTLFMNMNASYYEGTINADNTAKEINLVLDSNSKIKLTGDSYVTSLENADKTNGNIDFNGYKLYVNGILLNS